MYTRIIIIETDVSDLTVKEGDVEKITITYPVGDNYEYSESFSPEKMQLYFKLKNKNNVHFGFGLTDAKVTVTLPKNEKYILFINSKVGSIDVSGSVYDALDCTQSTGSFHAENIICGGLSVTTTTGSITLKNISAAGSVDAQATTGSINATNLKGEFLQLEATTGSVTAKKIEFSRSIGAKTSLGSIDLGIIGNKSEYYITVDAKMGSSNIASQEGTMSKFIYLTSNTGSINVKFN